MPKTIFFIFLLWVPFLTAQNYGTWRDTDSLNTARTGHAMVVLQNGNILVSGNDDIDTAASNRSCEIFDVSTESWRKTGSLNKPKDMHHMVLLDNGEVLAFGGVFGRSCEIFNPDTEEWRFTDSMLIERNYSSGIFTKLNDGRILIMSGTYWNSDSGYTKELLNCEIYDPIKEKWEVADSLLVNTNGSSAIKLNNGNILVAGSKYCQIYYVVENKWKMTDSLDERGDGNAMLMLDDGDVLLVGGGCSISPCDIPIDKRCAIYNTETNKWNYVGEIVKHRKEHSVFQISDRYIIIIGGDLFSAASWEIYDIEEFKTVSASYFNDQRFLGAYNTIQMKDDNILIVSGVAWGESGSMIYMYLTKRCSIFDIVTSIRNNKKVLFNYNLNQNYPNPYNPSTVISYSLPKRGLVQLKVYDILGQEIITLVNKEQNAGNYNVKFNAKDLSSGVYYYRIKAGGFVETKKMMLLR